MNKRIKQLVNYAEAVGLIYPEDRGFVINLLLDAMCMASFEDPGEVDSEPLHVILDAMCEDAVERNIIDSGTAAHDLFDTKLMGLLTPCPSTVIRRFKEEYKASPEAATDYFYKLQNDANYIRRDRIAKDKKWVSSTEYGDLDITINLSKPEKDPKAIAAARSLKSASYPKCMLCCENEGYAGRLDFPARQNHRTIPITINNTAWRMQYSPYVYYNEHCIAFNELHTPMQINPDTFRKLLSFVEQFPHYFVGSNADLPIVGGSILSHDHFQGGRYDFAMAKSNIETNLKFEGFEDIEAGIVKWPMSVIRLRSESTARLVSLAEKILSAWRGYTDSDAFIFAETDGEPHNTITPIARMQGGKFELDLVLRNNITTEEHPLGVYHPHAELHHIKKENIGLIEVMGLAVLPARLKEELSELKSAMLAKEDLLANPKTEAHATWAAEILKKHPEFCAENAEKIIEDEVGLVFMQVLEHAGVYKRNADGKAAFMRFVNSIGGRNI